MTDQRDAFSQLGLALLAAILIVYVVMVATFKSLRQPLELLVSVPFAATGAIVMLLITGVPLGVAGMIGALMLVGIVVTNAIVLIDLVNQYRARGLSVFEATVVGGARRPASHPDDGPRGDLRPRADGLGITGHGGFISQPLAVVVIGGLVSSTFLTLLCCRRSTTSSKERASGAASGGRCESRQGTSSRRPTEGHPLSRRELREKH